VAGRASGRSSHTASTPSSRRPRRGHGAPSRSRRTGEVVRGERGRGLVGVDGEHVEADPGERERIAADPAAEVGDAVHAGVAEPARVARAHRQARGLFEARAREQHPVGERAELRARARPQPRLADGAERARDSPAPAPRHGARHLVGGVDRAEPSTSRSPSG
jgi:hypothetical protein